MFCIWSAGFTCEPCYCHLAELQNKEWIKETHNKRLSCILYPLRGSSSALLWFSLQTSVSLFLKEQISVCSMLCPFTSGLPRHRLIIAQSDSLLIKPGGRIALLLELINRTCCSSHILKDCSALWTFAITPPNYSVCLFFLQASKVMWVAGLV